MNTKIPKPTITRLCTLHRYLEECQNHGIEHVSSSQMSSRLGIGSHNIRKDINYLGDVGLTGSGYNVANLKENIDNALGLKGERLACVVGLGRLGSAILDFDKFSTSGYKIVAGFDSNVNKLETMRTNVQLYASYAISDTVRRLGIELAVIAVPQEAAQKVTDKLVAGGIKGIVNFTPVVIKAPSSDVFISNIDVLGEFNILSALITLN